LRLLGFISLCLEEGSRPSDSTSVSIKDKLGTIQTLSFIKWGRIGFDSIRNGRNRSLQQINDKGTMIPMFGGQALAAA